MLKLVLDLFFPPCCGICGKLDSNWICDNCKRKINLCKKSIILEIFGKEYKEFGFLFSYSDIRNVMLDYKFNGKAYLSKTFLTIILEDKIFCDKLKSYDMIISVPMTVRNKARRGYNQTELIAKELCKNLNLEYNLASLVKIRNNKTQSTLNEKERFSNVKGVFEIKNREIIQNKKIILFDDIFTTGATVDECCKILKKGGAGDIFVFTLAKD